MSSTGADVEVFECGTCENVGIGRGEIRCCGDEMKPVADQKSGVMDPTLEEVLGAVFDISETELDVCLHVMEAGETTAGDLADALEYDRSVVSRHLNHLVELGALEKNQRLLRQGGRVYVYRSPDPATVRDRFRRGFLGWARRAEALIEAMNREKLAAILASGDDRARDDRRRPRVFEDE